MLYIDSVREALSRAENERDLLEIRQELAEQGYLRQQKTKGKQKIHPCSADEIYNKRRFYRTGRTE